MNNALPLDVVATIDDLAGTQDECCRSSARELQRALEIRGTDAVDMLRGTLVDAWMSSGRLAEAEACHPRVGGEAEARPSPV